jgi:chromate transporter
LTPAPARATVAAQMRDGPEKPPSRLPEVARLFLKLGFTAFGGPAAHVALMEQEVVTRRRWVDRQHFLDLVSAVNFIPGPNSTELAIHLGYVRAGWRGLIVAGVCFIVPAVLIVLPLAYLYVAHSSLPAVGDALVGIKACMVAIVAVALWRFAVTGIKDAFTATLGALTIIGTVALNHVGAPQVELIALAAAAIAGAIWYRHRAPAAEKLPDTAQASAFLAGSSPPCPPHNRTSLPQIFLPLTVGVAGVSAQWLAMTLFFLKVGATLFGSGYVLASFLHTGLVERHRWLTEQQLLDAIAVGQVTPGPLLTAATFIGYVLGNKVFGGGVAGGIGAGLLATAAIFLPSFVFVSHLGPVLPRLRQSRHARGALDGMNAAVVALIAVVTLWFARSALWNGATINWFPATIFAAALALLLMTKVNATWLIVAAGLLGWLVR